MNLYTLFIKCLLLFLASFLSATAHAEQVVVTSGRVEYDPFGRAVRVYCDRVLLSRHCISSFMTRSDTNYRNGVVDVLLDDFWWFWWSWCERLTSKPSNPIKVHQNNFNVVCTPNFDNSRCHIKFWAVQEFVQDLTQVGR